MKLLELWCTFRERLKGLIGRSRLEQDLDDEMAFHLAMRAEQHTAAGLAPEEADRAARKQFGNITFIKESLVLTVLAGALAIVLGQATVELLRYLKPAALPRVDEMALNWSVFGFTLLISTAAALAIGLLPALRVAKSQVNPVLGSGTDRAGESGMVLRGRESLIAVQVTLSVVLLVGAGLLARSLLALSKVDLGFDPQHALIFNLKTPEQWPPAQTRRFYSQVSERVGAVPGVEAVGYTNFGAPLEGTGSMELTVTASRTAPGRPILTLDRAVSPGYFRAFGIPVIQGTEFTERQLTGANNGVIINETFANRHWPGEDPVGKTVFASGGANPVRIIGVVKNVKEMNRALLPGQEIYIPNPGSAMEMLVGVRTVGDSLRLWPEIRAAVLAIDPNIPPYQVRRLEEVVSADLSPEKFLAGFLAVFAGIAACLAGIGIYGVVSYSAGRRTKEIGIRVALGAGRWEILRTLGGRYLAISGLGLAAGLAGSLLAARLFRRFLFQVEPYDPVTTVAVAALLILLAGIAAWLPVQRAASCDPLYSLKSE